MRAQGNTDETKASPTLGVATISNGAASLSEAVQLLEEALFRLKHPSPNFYGGPMQSGGAYWRLAHILKYLDGRLESDEGFAHANFIVRTHGRIQPIK